MTRTFATGAAPYLRGARSVRHVMALVLLALMPGVLAHLWYFGFGIAIQITLATVFALAFEAAMLRLRARPVRPFLTDLSAPVTAVLFALCIPPLAPWWIALIAMAAAMIFAKHLFGGLGFNRLNPAMVGYAVVLICFPLEFSRWLPPEGPTSEIRNPALFRDSGGRNWEWIAICYALGGLFLLFKRVIRWQVPVAMLGTVLVLSLGFWWAGAGVHALPPAHIFPGALMLAAFFIANDPVTGCTTPRGRLVFGAGVAVLAWVMQRWGGYLDGIAFAVLLMNCAAPWIDLHTRPLIFGHGKPS